MQLLLEQQRVGAEIDVALARDQRGDDLVDLLVHQRLSAGDRHHRCLAFLDRVDALLHRQTPLEDGILVLDLAAARAREVALIQRLELQHQRELLIAAQPLPRHVAPNPHRLSQWHRHGCLLVLVAYLWATSSRSVARCPVSGNSPPASARVGKTCR